MFACINLQEAEHMNNVYFKFKILLWLLLCVLWHKLRLMNSHLIIYINYINWTVHLFYTFYTSLFEVFIFKDHYYLHFLSLKLNCCQVPKLLSLTARLVLKYFPNSFWNRLMQKLFVITAYKEILILLSFYHKISLYNKLAFLKFLRLLKFD